MQARIPHPLRVLGLVIASGCFASETAAQWTSPLVWRKSLERAFREATERKAPLFLYLGETRGDDDFVTNCISKHGVLMHSLRQCVLVAGSKSEASFGRRKPASRRYYPYRFRHVHESDHARILNEAEDRLGDRLSKPLKLEKRPLFAFFHPDATVISLWVGPVSLERLRIEAKLALRDCGSGDPKEADKDEKLLATYRTRVRRGQSFDRRLAAQQLAALPLLAAREFLRETAKNRKLDAATRIWAIRALPLKGQVDSLAVLLPLIRKRDRRIRCAAMRSLGELAIPAVATPLLRCVKRYRDLPTLRELPRALLLSGSKRDECIKRVRGLLKHRDESTVIATLDAIYEVYRPHHELVASIEPLLHSRNTVVRDRSAKVLRELQKRK